MFDNAGSKIRTYAIIVFVISMIVLVVAGIILMAQVSFGIGCLVLVAGILTAYVGALFLSAFGELVESSVENRRLLEQLLKKLETDAAPPARPVEPAPKAAAFRQTAPQPSEPAQPVTIDRSSDRIVCPHCKREQPSNRTCCFYCGTLFAES